MAEGLEDGPPTLRQGSGDMLPPLWDTLLRALGVRDCLIKFDDDPPPPPGLGRYLVVRHIASGGMGLVFEALDPELGRHVAIKVCKYTSDAASTAIEHEARCLAKISHPNIVAVYEIIRVGLDLVLVMEYVEGTTLRRWQRANSPTWEEVLRCYVDAGRALAAVHAVGLEHADFKPDNVLVGPDRVRVVDFGLARHSGDGDFANVGTWPYMPPERLMENPGDGPRADVYAFCVSVWESLYGARPFAGKTPTAVLESIEAGELATGTELPGVPKQVRAVLTKGLSPRASDRWASMDELLRALRDASETPRRRVVRAVQWIGGGLVAMLLVASVVMARALLNEAPQAGLVETSASKSTTSQEVESTLKLAAEAVERGAGESAVEYLEAARARAREDGDHAVELLVADQAVHFGERLAEQGHLPSTWRCWDLAWEVFSNLGDRRRIANLSESAKRWGVRLDPAEAYPPT